MVKADVDGDQKADFEILVAHLVLLCHKVLMTAWTSGKPSGEDVCEANADGGDGVGDVAFGSPRGSRGVDNLWEAEVL